MNKKIIFVVLAILAAVLLFFVVKLIFSRDSGPAILKISSNPQATIFLDGQHLGKTPYENEAKSGEYTSMDDVIAELVKSFKKRK